ncbi:MAG: hypothetical protein IT518_14650 [Burkholderiales bacterium]|nr:hypothetical protein [Burkholderiales bacterium]
MPIVLLIGAIVLAVVVAAGGGLAIGYQWGAGQCAQIAQKRVVAVEKAKAAVAATDQKAAARLAVDDATRESHFQGVRREFTAQMDAKPDLAARECLDADVLRLINADRAGAVPAARPEPHPAVPAAGAGGGR